MTAVTKALIKRGARALDCFGGWVHGAQCMHGYEPADDCHLCAILRDMDRDKARTVLTAALQKHR